MARCDIDLIPMGLPLLQALLCGDRALATSLAPYRFPEQFDADALWIFRYRRDQILQFPEQEPWLLRAIVLRENSQMVGYANFHGPPGDNEASYPDAVSIGYAVFAQFRGRGFATQAVTCLLNWAAHQHGVTHIACGVLPDNFASIRVLEKHNFHRTELIVDGEVIFERKPIPEC